MNIHYAPLLPLWLIASLTIALLIVLTHGSWVLRRKAVPGKWVGILGAFRLVIVALLVLCLFRPSMSLTRTEERKPDLLALVDTSSSMATPSATGTGTRLDEARGALSGKLFDHLRRQYNVQVFAFDRAANPVPDLKALKPEGGATRLGESLAMALEYHQQLAGEGAPRPARVVLVTDGANNGKLDPVEVARQHAIALDVLPLQTTKAAADAVAVTIADIQAPRRVLLGSECELQVTLRRIGAVDKPVELHVYADDVNIATRTVTFATGADEATVRLTHRPSKPGLASYRFEVGAAVSERLPVQVVDTRNEVLVLDDGWRWEFKFLRRVLEDDPNFNLTAFLPRGPGFVQFAEPDRRATLGAFPQSPGDLSGFDVIVLGNVDPRHWPRGLAESIAQAVVEQGKSLVLVAGPNLPLLANGPVSALLPVEITLESGKPVTGPVSVRPTAEGGNSSFLANLLTIAGKPQPLPALDRIYPPLRKRPGATILLNTEAASNAYGNLIVMAEHTVGRGRVLFIGTDTLWKWQMLVEPSAEGQTPGTLFWQQTLRAMTPARPPSAGATVWLQPERTQYEVGQTVNIRAEVQGLPGTPQLQTTVKLPDNRELPLVFAGDPAKAGIYTATFTLSLPGEYVVNTGLLGDGKRIAEAATAVVARPAPSEQVGVPVDADGLQRLAKLTGGKVITATDDSTWPTRPDAALPTIQQTRTVSLWDNFSLLILLCAVMGADWTIRLLRGYV